MSYYFELSKAQSSLIKNVEYDETFKVLHICFQDSYYLKEEYYRNVPLGYFQEFMEAKSFGRFYLDNIKPIFKQIKNTDMSEENHETKKKKPKGINKASDKARYIEMSINLSKVNKDWLFPGEKGTYLKATLRMLPDGEVDKFECLGMITQKVPPEIAKLDKDVKGEILGNGAELEWTKNDEGSPLSNSGEAGLTDKMKDDLPF